MIIMNNNSNNNNNMDNIPSDKRLDRYKLMQVTLSPFRFLVIIPVNRLLNIPTNKNERRIKLQEDLCSSLRCRCSPTESSFSTITTRSLFTKEFYERTAGKGA